MSTEALTEDQELDAKWDELHAAEPEAPVEEAPPLSDDRPRDEHGRFIAKEGEEAPAEAAETPEEPEVKVEAPSHLPKAIRERWAALDEETRSVLDENQRDYAKRLQQAEDYRRAAGPVYDRLVQAAKDMPALQQQTPEQIAAQVFELAQWANRLETDPVGAIMAIASHRNVMDQLKAKFGEAPDAPDPMADLRQQVADLQQQLAQRVDPQAIESQVAQQMELARLQAEIDAFSRSKADWEAVQPHIAERVPEMRDANPHLGPIEVLEHTYNTVKQELFDPLFSAAATDAVKAQKADAARKAASINVQPSGAGEPPPMSEDDALNAIWDKHHG